ncbi:Hypothetical predicted protein [Octopus vulgaris]|uniref:Uncharacterized protein n=1 Tax=Octopus vulgaris TaxID=6645 RepID=A0AA36BU42_OCTVU|nr:Hypothetical predicted protein [Octopus vulgaris]
MLSVMLLVLLSCFIVLVLLMMVFVGIHNDVGGGGGGGGGVDGDFDFGVVSIVDDAVTGIDGVLLLLIEVETFFVLQNTLMSRLGTSIDSDSQSVSRFWNSAKMETF